MPSDIIAGLVLLRQRQRAKRNAVLDEVGTRPCSRQPPCNALCPGLWPPPLLLLLLLLLPAPGVPHTLLGPCRSPLDAHSAPIPAATTVALT